MEAGTLNPAQLTLQQVMAEGHRYHPFQLVELLQRLAAPNTAIRMRPSESLAFPAGDVSRVDRQPDGSLNVRMRFDGFYGVDSPLPHYFLEDAAVDTDFAERIRTFLDLFNLPFYQLRQAVWQTSRFYDPAPDQPGPLSRVIGDILPASLAETPECMQYPGLYLHGQPGIKSLAAMLRELLDCPQLQLVADGCNWQPLSQPSRLGDGSPLDGSLTLGRRVVVRGQLMTLQLGRLDARQAEQVQPGGSLSLTLVRALSAALPESIDWVLEFATQPDQKARQLGRKKLALGRAGAISGQPDEWISQRYVRSQYLYLIRPLN